MMMIVACGAKKLDREARARDLYVGSYFKACLAYALAIAPAKDIFILSAKYGLIGINDHIEPYDLKMGEPGSVTVSALSDQAGFAGLDAEEVTVLGGRSYVRACRKVWPKAKAPLQELGGLFKQIAWMRKRIEEKSYVGAANDAN
jgi:hypothetical protein